MIRERIFKYKALKYLFEIKKYIKTNFLTTKKNFSLLNKLNT